jgi:actin-like ATPase involved in cell morphogenesis
VSEDPLTCVARGAGVLLDNVKLLSRVALPS